MQQLSVIPGLQKRKSRTETGVSALAKPCLDRGLDLSVQPFGAKAPGGSEFLVLKLRRDSQNIVIDIVSNDHDSTTS